MPVVAPVMFSECAWPSSVEGTNGQRRRKREKGQLRGSALKGKKKKQEESAA